MLDKLKALAPAAKGVVASVLGALVLIWFWHPVWQFLGALCDKADHIFPGGK